MGLEMALNEVFKVLHVIDIQNYTIIDVSWGIGKFICKYYDKRLTYIV